ncbi:uncharacterized protein PAC_01483 [Phialocephala subalpina]|uniref:Mid2 domain-containing protein n=1 Tax=Phialocephala subalpina TaxID=576137 RepID=A0A1L7WFQ7_9HELO|nr:uncharacterized protein PAC_01483 [Phialocephala subalpina]
MLQRFLFTQLMLFEVSLATVAQTCVWKDGSIATGFLPCTTNSTATSGNCCLNGETCLSSGLCYGNIGLVYRGACINTWGGECVTYCDDIASEWANLLPCPFANTGSSDGPQSFWCGADGTSACVASNESHFITVNPSAATRILTATSSASVATSTGGTTTSGASGGATLGAATTSGGSKETTSAAASSGSSSNGTAIGLGVGLGVLALAAVAAGFWALRSYRRQKAQLEELHAHAMQQGKQGAFVDYQPKPEINTYGGPVYREMDSRPPFPTELEGNRAELGER